MVFRNGVGDRVAMSISNSEEKTQDLNMDNLQCSGWMDTQRVANNDESKSSDDDQNEVGLKLLAPNYFPNSNSQMNS